MILSGHSGDCADHGVMNPGTCLGWSEDQL